MVRNILVQGWSVSLAIILTIQGLGASEVHISFGSMTDEERAALTAALRKDVHTSVYDEDSILGEIYSSLAEEIDYRLTGSSER